MATVGDALGITPEGRPTFGRWMNQVSAALTKMCGLGYMDLADYGYRDAYDDGESPDDVARAVLEDNGFPFDDDEHETASGECGCATCSPTLTHGDHDAGTGECEYRGLNIWSCGHVDGEGSR